MNEIIERGYASNRTEAIRHAVLECRDRHLPKTTSVEDDDFFERAAVESARRVWDNAKDDKTWNKY